MMSLAQAAYVIGRRDFVATVMSKTFLLFLLGPIIPIAFGVFFAGMGDNIGAADNHPAVAVVGSAEDFRAIEAARERLLPRFPEQTLPDLIHAEPDGAEDAQIRDLLTSERQKAIAVLTGGVARPKLTGSIGEDGSVRRHVSLIIDEVRQERALEGAGVRLTPVTIPLEKIGNSVASLASGRSGTAAMSQSVLFVLTMLLATLLLSNLVEEKSSKVIEVLSAAVPMNAIFLGKLLAMLAISFIGIALWATVGALAATLWMPSDINLPAPAVGWAVFVPLIFIYYAASYLLFGGLLLGIGAQASSIREIQTVSMPVTMGQLAVFGLAIVAIGKHDSVIGLAAAIFPFSSPFAMIARAAELPELWPHLVALIWQALWVWLIVRLSAGLFRRSVLKSGSGGGAVKGEARA